MVDESREQSGGVEAGGSDGGPPVVTVAVDPSDRSAQRGGRAAWLVVAGLLVVSALAVTAVVVTRAGDDTAGGASKLLLFDPTQAMVAALGMEADGSPGTSQTLEYRLVGELADLGTSATVYRQVPVDLTQDQVEGWAATLGMTSPVEATDWGWSASDGAGNLWIERDETGGYRFQYDTHSGQSGSLSSNGTTVTTVIDAATFTDGREPYLAEPIERAAPVDVPDAATAEQIARDLLAELGVVDGEWTYASMDGATTAFACAAGAECPSTPPQVWSRTIVATRHMDGHVAGSQFWNVVVGSGGAIELVNGALVEVEAVGDYPLVTTRQAFDDLEAGLATRVGPGTGFGFGGSATSAVGMIVDQGSASSEATTSFAATTTVVAPSSDGSSGPDTTLAVLPDAGEPSPDLPGGPIALGAPVIEVTGVALGLSLMTGEADGVVTRYLVPSYRFHGDYVSPSLPASARGVRQDVVVAEVLALDGSSVTLSPQPIDTATAPAVAPDAPRTHVTEPAMTPGSSTPGSTGPGSDVPGAGATAGTAPPLSANSATTVPPGSATGPTTAPATGPAGPAVTTTITPVATLPPD